ncbi:hypothetical protein FHX06_001239 [Rhizobium sp. BK512]|uniref:immunity protein TriTu family protein n=1 Tax=Rhizobium sp. BK512 TaxID=2587010 RepID=UPI00161E5B44|nr:hypothetical protein [Rhizobium sp. BK512]MBB3559928.1 hypothetical protein [Rhizobium sp. BK512]
MSDATLIDSFIAWGARLAAATRSSALSIHVEVCTPTPNPAAKIDIENSELIARITMWSDGNFHAEAIDAATSSTVVSRHGHAVASAAFGEEFNDILKLFAIY